MPTVETKIWLALKSRIDTLTGYRIAWPAKTFTPVMTEPYIRVGTVTAQPMPAYIADSKPYVRTGFIVLTLVYPLGADSSVYVDAAGRIAQHFSDETSMQYSGVCVKITSCPHIVDGYEDNGLWNIPIRISWRTFA